MAILKEKVTSIHHWTDKTFSFKTTRNLSFRFKNGEFAMIGLEISNKPLLRAYSVVSPNHEDHLEFLSIKVPNGPLTSKLQHIKIDDEILIIAGLNLSKPMLLAHKILLSALLIVVLKI